MLSIENFLQMPRFSDIKLLTDAQLTDITQPIQSVEVSETPDIEHYIAQGTLLLTTGMSFTNNQKGFISLIDSLIRAKAVGLGIKTGRFLGGQIDPQVIAYAEEVNFPLINIPDNYSLGSLLHQLLNDIWGTRYEEVSFALDIQHKFSNLLIQNANNELIINELSQMIKTPTILLDSFKDMIAHSTHFNRSNNPAQHYVDQVISTFKATGKTEGSLIIKDQKGNDIHVSIVPINVHSYFPHYLIILYPEQIPYPISSFAIEQAAIILSFILFKNEKVDESQQSLAAEYFKEMVDYNSRNENVASYFEPNIKHGYLLSNFYQVIHVYEKEALSAKSLNLYQEEQLLLASQWLSKNTAKFFRNGVVIHFNANKETLILIQKKPDNLSVTLKQMADTLQEQLPISLIFSVGNPCYNWEQINQSYTEAKLVFDERKEKQQDDLILYYQDKGMLQLFNNIDKNDIRFFCKNTLKEFAYPEDSTLIDLRKTLEVYLDSQCEISSTAAKLFVHRNTVKYRIQRCEEILGHDVNSPEHSLNLRLALSLSSDEL